MYNRRFSVFYLLVCNKENQFNEIKCHLLRITAHRDFTAVKICQEEKLKLVDLGHLGFCCLVVFFFCLNCLTYFQMCFS